jgi:hypothetical protein
MSAIREAEEEDEGRADEERADRVGDEIGARAGGRAAVNSNRFVSRSNDDGRDNAAENAAAAVNSNRFVSRSNDDGRDSAAENAAAAESGGVAEGFTAVGGRRSDGEESHVSAKGADESAPKRDDRGADDSESGEENSSSAVALNRKEKFSGAENDGEQEEPGLAGKVKKRRGERREESEFEKAIDSIRGSVTSR